MVAGAELTAEALEFARSEGFADPQIIQMWREFVDFWVGVPGQRGLKLDWPATWRNRVRDVKARRGIGARKNGQDLALWTPSTDLTIEQQAQRSTIALRYATSPQEAIKAARRLAGSWPHARPPDPDGYAASLASAFAAYPLGVVEECADPRFGLAQKREFPPTVASIVEWCDRRLKYHQGMVKWGESIAPEEQFTDVHRKTMLGRLQDLMRGLLRADRERGLA